MDFLKKVELLLNAATRSKLPRRSRPTILDEEEEKLLAEIRRTVADVQAQEQALAERLKAERTQAGEAAVRGDQAQQRAHERRALELERQLEQESVQAINLEEKLAALEEKLALAQAAVEQEAHKAAARGAEADKVMAEGEAKIEARTEAILKAPTKELSSAKSAGQEPGLEERKSRLSD
jgi:fused signal recognition particle receptor